ncbi:hypothetical protein F1734_01865 [Rhodococcus ruber]|nr:hypothetical protein F1734_01865 [Rhodococcus ruber]
MRGRRSGTRRSRTRFALPESNPMRRVRSGSRRRCGTRRAPTAYLVAPPHSPGPCTPDPVQTRPVLGRYERPDSRET